MVALLELRQDDDLNVRVSGTLGERFTESSGSDAKYLFSDDSGVTVILNLDSRAELDFAFAPGTQLELIGELEPDERDENVAAGVYHGIDAVWIRLADETSLDIGQFSPFTGSTISDWIGYFWKLEADGWYYHPGKGFVYGGTAFGDDDWFFSSNRADWFYVSRSWYPFIYSSTGGWHYLIGSAYGGLQHAYSYALGEWILDYWGMIP